MLRQFTVGDQEPVSETTEFSATVDAPIFADEDYQGGTITDTDDDSSESEGAMESMSPSMLFSCLIPMLIALQVTPAYKKPSVGL